MLNFHNSASEALHMVRFKKMTSSPTYNLDAYLKGIEIWHNSVYYNVRHAPIVNKF